MPGGAGQSGGEKWTVLVVDDDRVIHAAIRQALTGSKLAPEIDLRSAHSAAEAEELSRQLDRAHFAVAFVDVVMERQTSGLELVGTLRDRFGKALQVIMLTGGSKGEELAERYEISNYLPKQEATPERLRTLVSIALRTFRTAHETATSTGEDWGKYRLEKVIGSGGMAQVYLATMAGPEGFEKRIVVKRLLPHLSHNKVFVEMFLSEARLSAKLSHPNIVQIFDLGKVGDQYYLAMEYVRGWDLNALLFALAALQELTPIAIACRIISEVAAGLSAAHRPTDEEGRRLGIIHRDVSPQNILLSTEGQVKLTDFGIAKAAGNLSHTEPGMVRGKVAYMSPEQARGETDLDFRTDIFAASVILYHLITGRPLFHRGNQVATLHALLHDTAPPLGAHREGVPARLEATVAKGLAKEKKRRFSTAQELRDELEATIREMGPPVAQAELANWLRELSERASRLPDNPLRPGTGEEPAATGSGETSFPVRKATQNIREDKPAKG